MDWTDKVALVFSNELEGAKEEVLGRIDGFFTIPMAGFSQSLNVSVAAGIVIHHVLTKKRKAGDLAGISNSEADSILEQWVRKSVRSVEVVIRELEKKR
jgi:tRNA (guanosine-2'-O-)-methyltransferase